MTSQTFDIAILGSGFGGSLLSTLLAKSGLKVALVDRSRHPRFAIGESSTPLANLTLHAIADEFDLPELKPLSQYGSWKQTHPNILCGLKRGFSYFKHSRHEHISAKDMLLVAASDSNEHSDTHWLRSDVDAFSFGIAKRHGVSTFENATYRLNQVGNQWQMIGCVSVENFSLTTDFVIDATGGTGGVFSALNVADDTKRLKTNSAALFAHFANVRPVTEILHRKGIDQSSHPFPCDAAAVHHILDEGWMWQLRFDDDTVSCGFVFNRLNTEITDAAVTQPEALWQRTLQRYPSLAEQFSKATIVRPQGGLISTGRLQRLAAKAAGSHWAALPAAVGFVDPLHSTGIAHTLFAVRRLARILTATGNSTKRQKDLEAYSKRIIAEIQMVDELVEGCYAALPDFRLWSAWCMLYFSAVTSMEQKSDGDVSFLRTDDRVFRNMIKTARQHLGACVHMTSSNAQQDFENWLRDAIEPWNHVGLLDTSVQGMYAQTAAPHRR